MPRKLNHSSCKTPLNTLPPIPATTPYRWPLESRPEICSNYNLYNCFLNTWSETEFHKIKSFLYLLLPSTWCIAWALQSAVATKPPLTPNNKIVQSTLLYKHIGYKSLEQACLLLMFVCFISPSFTAQSEQQWISGMYLGMSSFKWLTDLHTSSSQTWASHQPQEQQGPNYTLWHAPAPWDGRVYTSVNKTRIGFWVFYTRTTVFALREVR